MNCVPGEYIYGAPQNYSNQTPLLSIFEMDYLRQYFCKDDFAVFLSTLTTWAFLYKSTFLNP